MALSAVEELTTESEAHEEAEPMVEAVPKIGRAAFLYREPRPGIDGLFYHGSCASCQSFVPESVMAGAVIGDRCVKFGSLFRVTDDSHCSLYEAWNSGLPCSAVTSFYALELRKGIVNGISPWSVGYKQDTCVQCQKCRFYDAEPSECEAMESLNERSPNLFELATEVKPQAWCSMWTALDDLAAT
jgi:hypothetical protein